MRKANDQGGLISNKKVSEIIALVDVNGDGDIDFDEFILCMQVAKRFRCVFHSGSLFYL
jgi:Ca2+-binding EF-hand superfamily protein